MLVGSKEKKIKGQHLISWGTLLSVWNSKWSELNFVGFLKWWSLTSPSIRQRTWLNCCAWGTKTARTSTTCKSSWLGKWARSQFQSRSVEIDDVDIKALWTALRQKTYKAKALVPGGAIQCVAVTQHRHCFSFCLWTFPSVYLRDSVDTRWTVCSYHFWSQYTLPCSDPSLLSILF